MIEKIDVGDSNTTDTINSPATGKALNKILIILLIIVGGILLVATMFSQPDPVQAQVISGKLVYSGLSPNNTVQVADEERVSHIEMSSRRIGDKEFEVFQILPVIDGTTWTQTDAEANETYEIKSTFFYKNEHIKDSESIIVTGPAVNEIIDMSLSIEDLTPEMAEELKNNPDLLGNAEVTGFIDLNGEIRPGSTIDIYARVDITEENFYGVVDTVNAVDGVPWFFEDAKSGVPYEFRAILIDNEGSAYSASALETAVAPKNGVALRVNVVTEVASPPSEPSETTPDPTPSATPVPSAKISGTLDINGQVESNSSILLLERLPGQTTFREFGRVAAVDGQYWEWPNAVSGQVYEITAALQVTENNTATADQITTTAPASNEVLRINTGISLSTPSTPIFEGCNNENDSWYANLRYKSQTDAESYWIKVGTQQGSNDVYDQKNNHSEGDYNLRLLVNQNNTYYTQYAYALCTNCSNNSYSPFSSTLSFNCEQQPTPTPSPSPTATATSTPTTTPTSTPSPTPTVTPTPTPIPMRYFCNSTGYSCELTTDPTAPYPGTPEGLQSCLANCIEPTPTPTPTPSYPPGCEPPSNKPGCPEIQI